MKGYIFQNCSVFQFGKLFPFCIFAAKNCEINLPQGSGNGLNGAPPPFHWEDEEDEEEDLYSNPQFRYKAPSPGAMLLQKLNSLTPKLKSSLTPRKYKNLDIIDMSEQEHLGDI